MVDQGYFYIRRDYDIASRQVHTTPIKVSLD